MVYIFKGSRAVRVGPQEDSEISGGSVKGRSQFTKLVNNPTSSFQTGLGTGSPLNDPVAAKSTQMRITRGSGALEYGLKNLSFSSSKKDKNIKLKA